MSGQGADLEGEASLYHKMTDTAANARDKSVNVERATRLDHERRRRRYLAKRDRAQLTSPHIEHTGKSWSYKNKKYLPITEDGEFELAG